MLEAEQESINASYDGTKEIEDDTNQLPSLYSSQNSSPLFQTPHKRKVMADSINEDSLNHKDKHKKFTPSSNQ